MKDLADELGYEHFYITKGQDKRGINVAFLLNLTSKMTTLNVEEILLDEGQLNKPTRNILELTLKIKNEVVKFYVNHRPSQSNPTTDRIHAAETIEKRVLKNIKNGYHSVVVGDLNVKKSEFPNPIDDVLIGGDSRLVDLETRFRNSGSISDELKKSIPPSSYYYKRGNDWTHLDRILVSDSLIDKKGIDASVESFRIYAHPNYSKETTYRNERGETLQTRKPERFYYKRGNSSGASDHFPISFKLKF